MIVILFVAFTGILILNNYQFLLLHSKNLRISVKTECIKKEKVIAVFRFPLILLLVML